MALICKKWEFISSESQLVEIAPDGCRDIIFSISKDNGESFHIYEIANSTDEITIDADVFLLGFRLNPAAIIDYNSMRKLFLGDKIKIDNMADNINEIARIDENINEALHFLGQGNLKIETCAKNLGVSVRTMQREVLRKTGKTPIFWQQLARARKSAKSLYLSPDLTETAYDYGYSDQSHLNREMKRWFNKTPLQIAQDNDFYKMLCAPAYF
ncbi:MAG: helix-turn-helix transcriptional regulator [Caulobacterales bacterium]|nr:helix-turn-helix transcriptional regulator [Caulobacterales bacterium]MCA0371454.1 helix-turn-helix transcriptional regulator [Pseudomonadota bacterium]